MGTSGIATLSSHLPYMLLVDELLLVRIPSASMSVKTTKPAKTSTKKTSHRTIAPMPPSVPPTPTPTPVPVRPSLNVVPIDDVIKIVSNVLFDARTSLDPIVEEMRGLVEQAKHPLVTVNKSENVGPSTVGSTNAFFNDVKPILLSDSHRIALEALFGGEPLSKPDDVVRFAHRLSTVRLTGPEWKDVCSVTIPLDTLERLEARRPIDTTLKEMIERGFSDYLEGLINGVF